MSRKEVMSTSVGLLQICISKLYKFYVLHCIIALCNSSIPSCKSQLGYSSTCVSVFFSYLHLHYDRDGFNSYLCICICSINICMGQYIDKVFYY